MSDRAEFDRRSARIVAGRGVVARFPGVLCLADAADVEPVRAFLGLCAAVAGFEPGRPLGRRLAAWLLGQGGGLPGLRFGTLADAGDRWAVFLSGAVSLRDSGSGRDALEIRGEDAAAWVDRLIVPTDALTLVLDDGEDSGDGVVAPSDVFADLHDLRAGTVPGRGVVLRTAGPARSAGSLVSAGQATPVQALTAPSGDAPAIEPVAVASEPVAAEQVMAQAGEPSVGTEPDPTEAAGLVVGASAIGTRPKTPMAEWPVMDDPVEPGQWPGSGRLRDLAAKAPRPPVPAEEPAEVTIGDESGPDAMAPVPAAPGAGADVRQQQQKKAPRRAERIDRSAPPPARAPLPVGRPLSPADRRGAPDPRHGAATALRPDPGAPDQPDRREEAPVVEGPRTRGHLCSRGHLNDPRSHFCVLCGIRMNERTGELVFGARPPLGLLVLDDGATYTVDAEYLVGRMPDVDERVRNGTLRSIVIEDRSGAISRVHAEVRVRGWDVLVTDSRSRNGTHVAEPGAAGWTTLPAGRAHRLTPGTRVRLGSRTFLFESPSGVR